MSKNGRQSFVKKITLKVIVKTIVGNQEFNFDSKEELNCATEKKPGDPMNKDELLSRYHKLTGILDAELGPNWEKPNIQDRLKEYFE